MASFLALTGCAEHKHDMEVYVVKSGEMITMMDDMRIWLDIKESSNHDCAMPLFLCVFIDTYQKSGFPYTLRVASRYSGETKDTAKILGLKMKIGSEQEMDMLGKNQDKIEISHNPPADPARPGTIRIPLGDKLPFQEGLQVTCTMTFQLPNSKAINTVKYVFVGTTKRHVYTTMDALGSV